MKSWTIFNFVSWYFLVHLHLIHVQEFIVQKDDMSLEQIINYQSVQVLGLYLPTVYLLTVPSDTVFGYNYTCTVIEGSAFASSVVHGAKHYPFRGTASHCLLHEAVGFCVPNYPSSLSLSSHDSACLVKINL